MRELKNVMERAPFLCENGTISAAQIPKQGQAQALRDVDEDEFAPEEQDRTQVFAPLRTPQFNDDRPLAEPPSSAPRRSEPILPPIDSEEERQRVLRAARAMWRESDASGQAAGCFAPDFDQSRRTTELAATEEDLKAGPE